MTSEDDNEKIGNSSDGKKAGLYYADEDGQMQRMPPGVYNVQPDGHVRKGVDWEPMLKQVKWEDVTGLIENWQNRGSSERWWDLLGMYSVVTLVVVSAGLLGWQGVIGGQAIAGFFGAAIGYLLSRASAGRDG